VTTSSRLPALYVAALGGVVDDELGGLRALLPSDAAARSRATNDVVLATDAPPGEAPSTRAFGSALLERCIRAAARGPPLAGVALPGELPRALPTTGPPAERRARRIRAAAAPRAGALPGRAPAP